MKERDGLKGRKRAKRRKRKEKKQTRLEKEEEEEEEKVWGGRGVEKSRFGRAKRLSAAGAPSIAQGEIAIKFRVGIPLDEEPRSRGPIKA